MDGIWVESPALVKNAFYEHFKCRFEQPGMNDILLDREFTNRISSDQAVDLESAVSKEEIKRAVWDCGIDKSLGPDGFTFGFYRRYWNLIEGDVVNAVTWFFHHGRIPNRGNSSFITLIPKIPNANMVKDFRPISLNGSVYKIVAKILANRLVMVLGDLVSDTQYAFVKDRQILNGPFILNELVQWCKKKRKQSMIFKVDFEKAYDSVKWDFIDTILKKFGFGDKWCNWIGSCLQSSRGSVLVNGSPTSEFQFFKGLKQGDPLSPLLFILVMESLHVSFQRVVDADVFHRASGLRINMNKSKLMGISVESSKVEHAVEKIGCMALKMPFKYLGSKVGDLMSRTISWNEVLECMVARLSRWKLKTISIGGRLTLLKSVLAVKKVMASKDTGGLGVASLFALNRALMFKWVWRFITQKKSLWTRVIKAIYDDDGKIGKKVNPSYPSIWLSIIQEAGVLKSQGIDIISFIKPKCGDGTKTSVLNDAWRGDLRLKILNA
ncbi:RNA-directed DNA polymerase, eukaryota [Tanacetum coccineum]